MSDDFLLSVLQILVCAGLAAVAFLVLRAKRKPTVKRDTLPQNAIVVDGSNVMHWGGEPSLKTLNRVLNDLENKGYVPIAFFDANVGYILGDSYFNEAKLASLSGLPADQICVVSKGVVADEAILMFATDHGLRIVTNDRFRDWRVQFPLAAKKGALLGGTWRDGSVVWRGKLARATPS